MRSRELSSGFEGCFGVGQNPSPDALASGRCGSATFDND